MKFLKKIARKALPLIATIFISGTLFWLSGRFIKENIFKKNYLTQVLAGRGPVIGYDAHGVPLYEEISAMGLFYYFGIMVFIIMVTYLFYRIMIRKKKKHINKSE